MPKSWIQGGEQLQGNIRRFGRAFGKKKRKAIERAADRILLMAVANAPEDEGDLRDSGRVEVSAGGNSMRVIFGGPDVPHAIPVHEHLSEYSPPSWQGTIVTFSPPGTGPKYLERAMIAGTSLLPPELRRDLSFDNVV